MPSRSFPRFNPKTVPRVAAEKTAKLQTVQAAAIADRIRALALSWPKTYEDAPWGHPAFKVGENRLFALMRPDGNALHLTVKLTAEEREIARSQPNVHKAAYVGRYGWVTIEITDEDSLEPALEWLRESYWLRAPVKLRDAALRD